MIAVDGCIWRFNFVLLPPFFLSYNCVRHWGLILPSAGQLTLSLPTKDTISSLDQFQGNAKLARTGAFKNFVSRKSCHSSTKFYDVL